MFTVHIWDKVCYSANNACFPAREPIPSNGVDNINYDGYFATFKGGGTNCSPAIWPAPETLQGSPVEPCEPCHHDWTRVRVWSPRRHPLVEVELVTEAPPVDAVIKCGPAGGQTPRRVFPESLHGPLPDGAGGIARTVNRLLSPRVLRRRSAPRLQSMIGRRVSEATRIEWGMRRYRAREEWQPATIQSRLQMPLLPADETSLRKHHWKHRDAAGHLVVKCGHRQRG